MGKEFAFTEIIETAATPEQVWDAIATGPGIDSWFMGHTDLDPGEGGTVRTEAGGGRIPVSTITTWQPPGLLSHRFDGPDGRILAYEFLVEAREGSASTLRVVTSGFLPGDDWADEYEAMGFGLALFFGTLAEYLAAFPGRLARPVTAVRPVVDWPAAWLSLGRSLGLGRAPAQGDEVRIHGESGVVYLVNEHAVGVRTGTAFYRYLRALPGGVMASHHLFSPADFSSTAEPAPWPAGAFEGA
jgi:uncharacterized protein YndB with AHSA1/START domain